MSEEPNRRRRVPVRWVTLGETVAIAAVVISGLGLYNSWNMRADTPEPATAATRAVPARPLTLKAAVEEDGRRLALSPADGDQVIQSQTVAFPKALGAAAAETTGNPRIEAGWVDGALVRASAGGAATAGDLRLPILVTTRYIEGGEERTDQSLYQLRYTLTDGGLFGGRHVRLRGLSLSQRGVKDGQARLDRMWRPAPRG